MLFTLKVFLKYVQTFLNLKFLKPGYFEFEHLIHKLKNFFFYIIYTKPTAHYL